MPQPDTLKQSKQLQRGGAFTSEQAELITNALVEATSHLATKDDLAVLKGELYSSMKDLRVEMKEMQYGMIKAMLLIVSLALALDVAISQLL